MMMRGAMMVPMKRPLQLSPQSRHGLFTTGELRGSSDLPIADAFRPCAANGGRTDDNSIRAVMTVRRNANVETAMQYLTWALEYIEKANNQKAACHARMALEALRTSGDKTDEPAI